MINTLKEKGFKLTPQRIEIIRILEENSNYHPSLNDIYEMVKKKLTSISFSTLYNTISTLEEIGLIKLFSFKNETRIELNPASHINIINKKTGKIIDINNSEVIEDLLKKLSYGKDKLNYVIVNVIFFE